MIDWVVGIAASIIGGGVVVIVFKPHFDAPLVAISTENWLTARFVAANESGVSVSASLGYDNLTSFERPSRPTETYSATRLTSPDRRIS